jgi:hypothetical protein
MPGLGVIETEAGEELDDGGEVDPAVMTGAPEVLAAMGENGFDGDCLLALVRVRRH